MTKVMTIVGTRPEIIRLSRVMSRLDKTVDHVLVQELHQGRQELGETVGRTRRDRWQAQGIGSVLFSASV